MSRITSRSSKSRSLWSPQKTAVSTERVLTSLARPLQVPRPRLVQERVPQVPLAKQLAAKVALICRKMNAFRLKCRLITKER